MYSTSSTNLTVHMHNFICVLMMLIFVLAKTGANDFNKSREAKALLETNWFNDRNTSSYHYTWSKVTCNEEGSVISIYLYCWNNEGLGDLRSLEFASFPNLEVLDIHNCKLEGSISEQIGLLSHLTYISLYGNQLTGKLPDLFSNLTSLESLYLFNNYLTDKLPVSFSNLTRLAYLDLSNNNFAGILPTQIVGLKNLYYLNLSRNNFIGQIPSSFGSMVNLTNLDLSANQLNGSIPPALTTNLHKLETLDLSYNILDGPVPSSFGSLSQLQSLNLSMNSISGPIPLDIANLMNLGHLDLHHNRLVGAIHPEFGKLVNLSYLDLSSNQLSGNLSLADPCSLLYLNLSRNLMTGAIISVLGCRNLEYLDIFGNHFVGKELNHDDFPQLLFLNQSQNHLNATSGQSETNEHKRRKQHIPRLTVFLPIIVGLCFLVVVYFFYSRKKATIKKIQPETTKPRDVCTIMNYDGKIAYEDFITAVGFMDIN